MMSHESFPSIEPEITLEESEQLLLRAAVEGLVERLDQFDFGAQSEALKDEWYFVEQEGNAGKDLTQAKRRLEALTEKLKRANVSET